MDIRERVMRRASASNHAGSRSKRDMRPGHPTSQRGFTLIEIIAVIIIIGILAVLAIPRLLESGALDSRGFNDQVSAALRYAQKAAIAQNRYVCVAFAANSITLTTGTDGACSANPGGSTRLTGPAGPASPPPCSQTTYSVCSSNASFTSTPSSFSFDAQGRPNFSGTQKISITGAGSICIAAETGYIYAVATGQSCS